MFCINSIDQIIDMLEALGAVVTHWKGLLSSLQLELLTPCHDAVRSVMQIAFRGKYGKKMTFRLSARECDVNQAPATRRFIRRPEKNSPLCSTYDKMTLIDITETV
jgi:hypothetical protein